MVVNKKADSDRNRHTKKGARHSESENVEPKTIWRGEPEGKENTPNPEKTKMAVTKTKANEEATKATVGNLKANEEANKAADGKIKAKEKATNMAGDKNKEQSKRYTDKEKFAHAPNWCDKEKQWYYSRWKYRKGKRIHEVVWGDKFGDVKNSEDTNALWAEGGW